MLIWEQIQVFFLEINQSLALLVEMLEIQEEARIVAAAVVAPMIPTVMIQISQEKAKLLDTPCHGNSNLYLHLYHLNRHSLEIPLRTNRIT